MSLVLERGLSSHFPAECQKRMSGSWIHRTGIPTFLITKRIDDFLSYFIGQVFQTDCFRQTIPRNPVLGFHLFLFPFLLYLRVTVVQTNTANPASK